MTHGHIWNGTSGDVVGVNSRFDSVEDFGVTDAAEIGISELFAVMLKSPQQTDAMVPYTGLRLADPRGRRASFARSRHSARRLCPTPQAASVPSDIFKLPYPRRGSSPVAPVAGIAQRLKLSSAICRSYRDSNLEIIGHTSSSNGSAVRIGRQSVWRAVSRGQARRIRQETPVAHLPVPTRNGSTVAALTIKQGAAATSILKSILKSGFPMSTRCE